MKTTRFVRLQSDQLRSEYGGVTEGPRRDLLGAWAIGRARPNLDFHQLQEGGWDGGLELQPTAGDGVGEAEAEGMEAEPVDRREVVFVAVHGVVDHGVLQVAQVDAYLVAAAGVEFELDQAVAARGLLHLIVGDGQLATVVGG